MYALKYCWKPFLEGLVQANFSKFLELSICILSILSLTGQTSITFVAVSSLFVRLSSINSEVDYPKLQPYAQHPQTTSPYAQPQTTAHPTYGDHYNKTTSPYYSQTLAQAFFPAGVSSNQLESVQQLMPPYASTLPSELTSIRYCRFPISALAPIIRVLNYRKIL